MSTELYFLRSSEQHVVNKILPFAKRVDESDKAMDELQELNVYKDFYGLTAKDLGLYAMTDNEVNGAVWTRRLNAEHKSNGFIDENTPVLNIAIKPEFRGKGIGSQMMEQFLLEAGELYDAISVSVLNEERVINFFEKFDFIKVENSMKKSFVDGKELFTMLRKLEKKTVIRPSDGYDPTRWMD